MSKDGVLQRSHWPAEPGDVRETTVCDVLYHAAATVPDRVALVDCLPDPATRREWAYPEFVAAVIGVPGQSWGEQLGAVLKIHDGYSQSTVDELTGFLRGELSPQKAPLYWTFVGQLPMTSTVKIQKFAVRDRAADGALSFDAVRESSVDEGVEDAATPGG